MGVIFCMRQDSIDCPRFVEDLEPGQHLCEFYYSEEEVLSLLSRFLRLGLEREEKTLCIAHPSFLEFVRSILADKGVDVDQCGEEGRLDFLEAGKIYLQEGYFDPERVIAFLRDQVKRALDEGFAAMRVAGEMNWFLERISDNRKLVEYESKLNSFFPGNRCLGICLYDGRHFDSRLLLSVLATHPVIMVGGEIYENFFYIPPEEFLGSDPMRSILSRCLQSLEERKREDEKLRYNEEYFRSLIEKAEDLIAIINEDGTVRYVSPSVEKISGYPPEEVLGRSFLDLVHPDDVSGIVDLIYQHVNEPGATVSLEVRLCHRYESWRTVEVIAKNLLFSPVIGGIVINARDISERKRAEEMLMRSEVYFRSLIESASDLITVLDMDGNILYESPSVKRLFGYLPEEMLGKNVFDFVHSDDVPGLLEILYRERENPGASVSVGARFRHKDGSWRYVESRARNLLFDEIVGGIVVNSHDVTEEKEAERALRESEKKFRELFQYANDAIALSELRDDGELGCFIEVNRIACRRLGYSREEFLEMTPMEVFPEEHLPAMQATMRRFLERGHITFETELVPKQGPNIPVEISSHLFTLEGRQVILSIVRDITERRKIQERLRKLNHCFLSLGADPRENIARIVSQGREILEGVLMKYHRLSMEHLSISSVQQGVEELDSGDRSGNDVFYDLVFEDLDTPLIVRDLETTEFKGLGSDIRRYDLRSMIVHPVKLEGKLIGCLLLYDNRRREFTEEESEILGMLARAVSIEEERWFREENLREFIDIASHELRHPISLIKGYAESMECYGEEMSAEARRELSSTIDHMADRLGKLVSELLDTSHIERGKFPLRREEIFLPHLIQQAFGEMRARGAANEFILRMEGEVGQGYADLNKLAQLLLILIENAVNYSPPGSEIEVVVEGKTDKGTSDEAKEIMVSVMDRGRGVPEKDRQKIFERFYQVEDALHHSTPGIGLGLYIARQIVESHGGRIWHEPRDGGGSIFRFTLPTLD